MKDSFFVEVRLQGFAKQYANWVNSCIRQEASRLRIGKLKERRFVSHIALFGPAQTNNLSHVIAEIEKTCRNYTVVPFKMGGFDSFENPDANWLYLDIKPSSELERLRYELAQNLINSERMIRDTCQSFDHRSTCKFHSSIGKYPPKDKNKFDKLLHFAEIKCDLGSFKKYKSSKFQKLLYFIKQCVARDGEESKPNMSLCLLRITVLGRGSRIQCEYDIALKKLLSRREAFSKHQYHRSIKKLQELQNHLTVGKSPVSNGNVYFIGDTHFDHKNIIKYTHRPFASVTEMNNTIKNNWNSTVGNNEKVYFLGDWAFGRGHKPAKYWQGQLKGVISSIRGSHDLDAKDMSFENTRVLHANGYNFLLVHNPEDRNPDWRDWIIHGHVHNNNMDKYPFINGERKTINVSAELINYTPISLNHLLSLDLNSIKRMRTLDSTPERW